VRWCAGAVSRREKLLDVYERAGLLNARSVFAHGIWARRRGPHDLSDAGAQIAHSPSSNLFLGSGSSIGRPPKTRRGGEAWRATSAAAPACRCCARWAMRTRFRPWPATGWTAWKALHSATLGAAVRWDCRTRCSLTTGCAPDVCVWDWPWGLFAQRAWRSPGNLHERVFAWMTQADERNLVAPTSQACGVTSAMTRISPNRGNSEEPVGHRIAIQINQLLSGDKATRRSNTMLRLELVDISKRTRR